MKNLINTVKLRFFQDDATGDYGVAHNQAIDINNPFNAFWDGVKIFHDVFEHWFENIHDCFKDDYSFNIGGEIAAMGAAMYYYYCLNLYNRDLNPNSIYSFDDNVMYNTLNNIKEAVACGYCDYGYRLESNVPLQKEVNCYQTESMIENYCFEIKHLKVETECEQEKEDGKIYKKSVKKNKIRNLTRWGWRMAEEMVPYTNENSEILHDFIEYWNKFTENNNAEDLYNMDFVYLVFEIYKDKSENISWKAIFEDCYNKEYVIESQNINLNYVPDIYDLMTEQEEETEEKY